MHSPWRNTLVIICICLFSWVATSINVTDFSAKDIINYDVVVVGGGAAGTYAAVRLRDLSKIVAVVEKKSRLGGHTETYTDPISKTKIDIAVVVFHNTDFVRKYFARFNIPLTRYASDESDVLKYVDFSTGNPVNYTQPDSTTGIQTYAAQLAKYPFLDTSLGEIPHPVPADLLLPFGAFVKKYHLEDAMPFFSTTLSQGFGNILKLPSLYLLKYYSPELLKVLYTGSLTTARHDNSELYEKVTAELEKDVFLNSCILALDRKDADSIKIVIETPLGKKLLLAKKLISTTPPILQSLHGCDLDAAELALFSKIQYHSYDVGIMTHSGIPDNISLVNVGAHTSYNILVLPSAFNIFATAAPGLHVFQFGGRNHQVLPTEEAKANMVASIERMQELRALPQGNGKSVAWPVYSSHTPYECYVSEKEIASEFYDRLFALQGRKNTFWSGAAFMTHDSSAIWEYTETVASQRHGVNGSWDFHGLKL